MEHISRLLTHQLSREHQLKQLRFYKSAVEDATYALFQGGMSYRESETLARKITSVRAKISELEISLREPSSTSLSDQHSAAGSTP